MRFADVAPGALVTGVRIFGSELGEAFVQPARNSRGIESVHDEVHDLVT